MSPTSLLRGIAFYCFAMGIHAHHQRPRRTLSARSFGNADFNGTSLRQRYSGKLHRGNLRYPDFQNGYAVLPAGVSVILYADVIKAELLPITITIVVCSIVVLSVTAFFIEAMLKGKESQ